MSAAQCGRSEPAGVARAPQHQRLNCRVAIGSRCSSPHPARHRHQEPIGAQGGDARSPAEVHAVAIAAMAAKPPIPPRIRASPPRLPGANRACLPPSGRGDRASGQWRGRLAVSRDGPPIPHPPTAGLPTPTDRGAAPHGADHVARRGRRGVRHASCRRHPPSDQARCAAQSFSAATVWPATSAPGPDPPRRWSARSIAVPTTPCPWPAT